MAEPTSSTRDQELRDQMTDALVDSGMIASKEVEEAFRRVPRHLFAPEVSIEKAYDGGRALITKRDEHGVSISSISAPSIQATMLEQSRLGRGMRALEIGSGGYHAALMAEIVGPDGTITTIDIDPDIIDRAHVGLERAGYTATVKLADGELGDPTGAPYDRIIVTVGAWDIPPAWTDQLTDDGILTVPLRMNGLTRSIAFRKQGDVLVADSAEICGFVAMQGIGEHNEQLILLRGREVGLRFDEGEPADPYLLTGALDGPRAEAWSGVTVGRSESFAGLQLWLASTLAGFATMSVDPELDTGAVAPNNRIASPAIVAGDSFAHLAVRPAGDAGVEFGAHGYGPAGPPLAERLAGSVARWDTEQRHGPGPAITAYPADTPVEQMPGGFVLTKRHRRLLISWPQS
ncbi:methyltransferase, FxLD system [Rhizohabitans arisaemae]|uniref:methyltransferase, FxLD system n=1 Tax=Rhizohabitans arisaemae TaxID=2720610 RepID=UPI0024B1C008|nr:methyltransferase, FxLD system [Rhizohabitans arisaemae]